MINQTAPSSDVLIVGAGAIGCAIALELRRRGVRDVLVVDRWRAGEGSSNRAAGGIRALFPTEFGVRFSLLSQDFFRHAEDALGGSIDYRQTGYILLARTPEQAQAFQSNVAMQRKLGVATEWLSADEIELSWPWLRTNDIAAGAWCPTDATFDQLAFMRLLAARARDAGAELREGVTVRGLLNEGGRVVGVETSAGQLLAGTTILAAGVWSTALAATAGLELPISPIRGEIYATGPVSTLPAEMPFVADFDRGRYLRRDGEGFRISGDLAPAASLEVAFDPADGPGATAWVGDLVPALAGVALTGGWAGLVEITPDFHPLLGSFPGLDGLIVATGFCGVGVMHAPAAGLLVAELLLDGQTTSADIAPLSPARFAEGHPIRLATAPLYTGPSRPPAET